MATPEHLLHPDPADQAELQSYRPLCVSAVVGLVLGICSAAALLHSVAWLLPAIAVGVCLSALRKISATPDMGGRWAATVGLVLALFFGTFAPARSVAYAARMRSEARQFGGAWFAALQHGELERAYKVTSVSQERMPMDEEAADEGNSGLTRYRQTPLVQTLLALGEQAQVRYYTNERAVTDGMMDVVNDVYAVTYREDGQVKSFFVRMELARNLAEERGPLGWQIGDTDGGYRPKGWRE